MFVKVVRATVVGNKRHDPVDLMRKKCYLFEAGTTETTSDEQHQQILNVSKGHIMKFPCSWTKAPNM